VQRSRDTTRNILISRSKFRIFIGNPIKIRCSRVLDAKYTSEMKNSSVDDRLSRVIILHGARRGRGRGTGQILYLHSGAVTCPLRCNARTSGNIIATRESGINTLFVCHSSCEDQHKCTPRATRGYFWRAPPREGGGFYGLLIFTGSSWRDARAD